MEDFNLHQNDFPQMFCPDIVDTNIKQFLYRQPRKLRVSYIKKSAAVLASMIILAGLGLYIFQEKDPILETTSSDGLFVMLEEVTKEVQKEIIQENNIPQEVETTLTDIDNLLSLLADDSLWDL